MSEKRLPVAGPVTRLPADPFEKRMLVAGVVSVAANMVFLFAGAAIAARDYEDPNPPIEIAILSGTTTVKEEVKKAAEVKKPEAPKPEPKKQLAQVKPPRRPTQVASIKRPTPPRPPKPTVVRDVPKPPVVVPPPPAEIEQPDVPNKGTVVPQVAKRVEAAAPAPAALKGSAGGGRPAGGGGGSRPLTAQGVANGDTRTGGGEYTDVNSNLSQATGAPSIRQGNATGIANPSTGGPDPAVKGVGTGTVGITSNTFAAAKGPILGMPGGPAGPRNKVLTAKETAIIPDKNMGGFEIQQGANVKAGTPLRGQGSITGSLGNNNSAAPPKFAGGGQGAGTGMAGLKSDTFTASRGPLPGGGGGPIGPKSKGLAASYGGGELGAGTGDPNGTGSEGAGIVGSDGKPGKGAETRATGFGGPAGSGGTGVRVGVKDGTPGAPGYAATTGSGGGNERGPIGTGPGSGGGQGVGVRGPGGKSIGDGPGGTNGGNKLGNGPGNGGVKDGDPNGVLGGTGKAGGTGTSGNSDAKGTAKEAKGTEGGKDLRNTEVGVPGGKPDGGKLDVPAGKKLDPGASNRIEEAVKAKGNTIAGKTSAAIIKRRVEPVLPESARSDEFKKSITASFRINSDGTFSVSPGSSGNSEVDAAVRKALNQWQFEPAWDNGKRIATTLNVTINISVR